MRETRILIDNTTFAAAGRTFYLGDLSTEGGRHARDYYDRYHDARALDWQSAGELLTALVLFDTLCWDCASASGETPGKAEGQEPWLYRWFPLFRQARQLGILDQFEEPYVSGYRLDLARRLALRWVREEIAGGARPLPKGFRVPLAYRDLNYSDRREFEWLNGKEAEPLAGEDLEIAMFLHRGVYYQSYTYGATQLSQAHSWSYLPHAHRASLLQCPSWNLLSTLCSDEQMWIGALHKLDITAPELLRELDRRFFDALDRTVKIERAPGGMAIGSAFLQGHWRDGVRALEGALEFRETRAGQEVRAFFRELVGIGSDSNKQAIEDRLGDLEKLLRDAARRRFGTSWEPDPKAGFLLGLLGRWKDLLGQALDLFPRRTREAVTRVLYSGTHPHGFQILFNKYL